jgi:hypothetical protein
VRYTFGPITLATNATEAAVQVCYTPTGTKATNEFYQITGVQLEDAPQATAFEIRPVGFELSRDQRYAYTIQEGTITAGAAFVGGGTVGSGGTTAFFAIPLPVTMRKAPTYTNALSATTFKLTCGSTAAAALSTPFSATTGANTVQSGSITFTTTGETAGQACELVSAAGSGVMLFTADF